jgi:hypothetical protein
MGKKDRLTLLAEKHWKQTGEELVITKRMFMKIFRLGYTVAMGDRDIKANKKNLHE